MQESGELISANIEEDMLTEIGQIPLLDDTFSVYPAGNVVLKCVGMGVMDLAISRSLLELAQQSGVGSQVDWF